MVAKRDFRYQWSSHMYRVDSVLRKKEGGPGGLEKRKGEEWGEEEGVGT